MINPQPSRATNITHLPVLYIMKKLGRYLLPVIYMWYHDIHTELSIFAVPDAAVSSQSLHHRVPLILEAWRAADTMSFYTL